MVTVLSTEELLEEANKGSGTIARKEIMIKVRLDEHNNVDLTNRLDLRDCDFQEGSQFISTKMGGAILQGSHFSGIVLINVDLSGADFRPSPRLRVTELVGAQLMGSNLQRAKLEQSNLEKADLENADLSRANLLGASLHGANFKNAVLIETKIDLNSIGKEIKQEEDGEFLDAKFVYLNLKNNFLSIGAYDDASNAYVKERIMERKTFNPWRCHRFYGHDLSKSQRSARNLIQRIVRRKIGEQDSLYGLSMSIGAARFRARYAGKWLANWLFARPWGYGQRPFNALFICFAIIVVFAVLFSVFGGIEVNATSGLDPLDYLAYSIGAFISAGFNDVLPATLAAKYLTVFEGLLGLATFALFVNALGQRIGGH